VPCWADGNGRESTIVFSLIHESLVILTLFLFLLLRMHVYTICIIFVLAKTMGVLLNTLE
jgi:hypothetical protein